LAFLQHGSDPASVAGIAASQAETSELVGVPGRSAGLVWIVFYWSINAVMAVVGGVVGMYATGFAGGLAAGSTGFIGFGRHADIESGALVAVAVGELLALLGFHYGLAMMVTCYRLWTHRRWAPAFARILAVLNVVGNVLLLIASLIMRVGIVLALVGTCISVAIAFYLLGTDRIQGEFRRIGTKLRSSGEPRWDGYE
jgi:hypothetical protein